MTSCLICLQNVPSEQMWINDNVFPCDCYGLYHINCMNKWICERPICPICRKFKIFTPEEIRKNRIMYLCDRTKFCLLFCLSAIIGSFVSGMTFYFVVSEISKAIY